MKTLLRAVQLARGRLVFGVHGARLGARPRVVGRAPYVRNAGTMTIGERLVVRGHQFRAALTTDEGGSLLLGDYAFINQGATIHAALSVTIGDRLMMADLAAIYDTDFHELELGGEVRRAPVVIGDNVWIGRGAVVLPGVTIGSHAVLAAGTVVTTDVPAGVLVAGVPGRVVREIRHDESFRRA
jgi:acetyltransferase-like isoleucine patch superfamily enzyme